MRAVQIFFFAELKYRGGLIPCPRSKDLFFFHSQCRSFIASSPFPYLVAAVTVTADGKKFAVAGACVSTNPPLPLTAGGS